MVLIEDVGQKEEKHILKHLYFEENSIYWERYGLPVGDYVLADEKVLDVIARKQKRGIETKKMDFLGTYQICVDTKRDLQEVVGNLCGKAHARFRDECLLAKNNGIRLYVLVENRDGIRSIEDVEHWKNPRAPRYDKIAFYHAQGKWLHVPLPKAKPTDGKTLAKTMLTMQERYGVIFKFTTPEAAGAEVVRLLTEG